MTAEFMPKPTRRRGEERRVKIMHAAAEVFFEKGYEAASLSEIVARAGGSRSAIYDQFRDKEGLFEEIVIFKCTEILEPLSDLMLATIDPETTLRRLGEKFMAIVCSNDALALRRIVMSEGTKFPRVAKIFFDHGHEPAVQRLRAYFEILNAHYHFTIAEPYIKAIMFFSIIQGDVVERKAVNAPLQRTDRMIARQIDLAVEMVLSERGAQ